MSGIASPAIAGQSNDRGIGWEFVHVCIDDASRVAFVQVMPDEKKRKRRGLPESRRRLLWKPRRQGRRVMTDNGSCYRAYAFRHACRDLGLAHPHQALHAKDQRKGRALHPDRAARVGLRQGLPHSDERTAELPLWLHRYNWHRPHGSLKAKTPISRLGLSEDNLLRLHSKMTCQSAPGLNEPATPTDKT